MEKIITVSEPDCGAKPTIYAAWLNHANKSALRRHVESALSGAKVEVDENEIRETVDMLYENDYAWYGERFLVEVNGVDMKESTERSQDEG